MDFSNSDGVLVYLEPLKINLYVVFMSFV